MKQQCDEPRYGVPKEKWYDIKVQGDYVVFGKELTCRDLIVDGNFILIGNLFCNNIDIKGNCVIYGSIYACAKVQVQGDLCIYTISESRDNINGGFFAPCENVEIGGNLICEYRIRTGSSKIKVGGDVITRDVECKAISVAGDCIVYPGTIDSDEAVYVLGDVTTGFAIESTELYCGGTYTRKFYCEKETAKIYENFKHWFSKKS